MCSPIKDVIQLNEDDEEEEREKQNSRKGTRTGGKQAHKGNMAGVY